MLLFLRTSRANLSNVIVTNQLLINIWVLFSNPFNIDEEIFNRLNHSKSIVWVGYWIKCNICAPNKEIITILKLSYLFYRNTPTFELILFIYLCICRIFIYTFTLKHNHSEQSIILYICYKIIILIFSSKPQCDSFFNIICFFSFLICSNH